jgi:hypothetical protein
MAQAAAATTPTAADDAPDATGAPDAVADQGDDQQPAVIATILCYPDGSYGLVQGDEDDSDDAADGDAGTEGESQEPQKFDSEGALLKGVLETVRDYDAKKSGEGTEADNFKSAYGPEPEAPMQQKYSDQ